jgi:hypothetical protein
MSAYQAPSHANQNLLMANCAPTAANNVSFRNTSIAGTIVGNMCKCDFFARNVSTRLICICVVVVVHNRQLGSRNEGKQPDIGHLRDAIFFFGSSAILCPFRYWGRQGKIHAQMFDFCAEYLSIYPTAAERKLF